MQWIVVNASTSSKWYSSMYGISGLMNFLYMFISTLYIFLLMHWFSIQDVGFHHSTNRKRNKSIWIHVSKFSLPNKSKGYRKISLKESWAYSRPLEKSKKRTTHSHAIQSFVSFNFHLKLLQLFMNLYYFYNCLLIHGFVLCFFSSYLLRLVIPTNIILKK